MNGHSDYIMMPGARLEVGPHGQLDESLGRLFDMKILPAVQMGIQSVYLENKLKQIKASTPTPTSDDHGGSCCSACANSGGSCGSKSAALGVGPLDQPTPGLLDYAAVPGFTILNALGVPRVSYAGTPPSETTADLIEIVVGGGLAWLVWGWLFKKRTTSVPTSNPSRRRRRRRRR